MNSSKLELKFRVFGNKGFEIIKAYILRQFFSLTGDLKLFEVLSNFCVHSELIVKGGFFVVV
jgi:hypothetical protein